MGERRQLKSDNASDATYGGVTNDVEIGTFEAGLKINKHDLDNELIGQPHEYQQVADRYAIALSKRDAAKDNLKTVSAETSLSIRADLLAKGEKVTETLLEQMTQITTPRKQALQRYIEAEELVNRLEALKWAYHSRADMLQELCRLFTAGYFQTPSARGPEVSDYKNAAYEDNKAKLAAGRQQRSNPR